METKTLSNLATRSGRKVYQEYWHDLVIEQQGMVIPSLWQLFRTAAFGKRVTISETGATYSISHPLGIRSGLRVFMEEVIVRHYFNNVQALVYLGAVLLLIFLALRFAGLLSEQVALIGIGIEVLMLFMLFVVLFYAPEEEYVEDDEVLTSETADDDNVEVIREVLSELEEIGSAYASIGMRLEELAKSQERGLKELNERVSTIKGLDLLESHAERLDSTNDLLDKLVKTMASMSDNIEMLVGKELEYHVRRELERRISGSIIDENENSTG